MKVSIRLSISEEINVFFDFEGLKNHALTDRHEAGDQAALT
jgi:hypothetical protein